MKLQLRSTEPIKNFDIMYTLLQNRGVEDCLEWIYLSEFPHGVSYESLDQNSLWNAYSMLCNTIYNNHKIAVIVDCDVDGYTSASIFCSYLWEKFGYANLQIIHHTDKQHGLSDTYLKLDDDARMVVLPDAGSNDVEYHAALNDRGIVVLCLDHHEVDQAIVNNQMTCVINNQLAPNASKNITGVAVTWLFLKYFEDTLRTVPWGTDFDEINLDKYMDLVALGCLSDMADYRDISVRYIVHNGLQNITNPFFAAMCDKQSYSMNKMGGNVYMAVAFYVTPYMNAVCRTGTQQEKELLFNSMTMPWSDKLVPSTKRGHVGEMVPITNEAVFRLGKVKERQTDIQNAGLAYIEELIAERDLNKNSVIVACCDADAIDPAVCGLVANKLQSKYQKPVFVLREIDNAYKGSARNYSMSEVEDLKGLCESSGYFELCAGHKGAFGSILPTDNLKSFVEYANAAYENVSTEPVYWIDFMFTQMDFKNKRATKAIDTIFAMKEYWGQQIPEAKVGIRIPLSSADQIELIGKNKNTIKMNVHGVDVLKFQSSEEEYESWLPQNEEGFTEKYLVAYCSCSVNEYGGKQTPQFIIEDYFLDEDWIF